MTKTADGFLGPYRTQRLCTSFSKARCGFLQNGRETEGISKQSPVGKTAGGGQKEKSSKETMVNTTAGHSPPSTDRKLKPGFHGLQKFSPYGGGENENQTHQKVAGVETLLTSGKQQVAIDTLGSQKELRQGRCWKMPKIRRKKDLAPIVT